MFRLAWILMPVMLGRIRANAESVKRRAGYLAVAGILGLVAAIFALVTITVLISRWLGLLGALGLMTAAALIAAGVVLLALRSAERRAAAKRGPLQTIPAGVYISSLSRLMSRSRGPRGSRSAGRAIGLGALALGVVLLVTQAAGGDDADDDA